LIAFALLTALSSPPQRAAALDTPNVLMGIDGMTLTAEGLFVNGTPNDGFGTFRYFAFSTQPGHVGRYKSAYLYDTNVNLADNQNFLGISHNSRSRSDTPEFFNETQFSPAYPLDLTKDFFPIVDRSAFGQVFDPSEYQIEVKFKPILPADPFPIKNEAHTFRVQLEQHDGFVFDAEAGIYKRANDNFNYVIGTEAVGINDWYSNPATPKDADGFATYTVPLLPQPTLSGKGSYGSYVSNEFRDGHWVAGGGRVQDNMGVWQNQSDGLDPLSFGGGPTDASRPDSQLRVPNGVPFIGLTSVGGDGATQGSNADAGRVFSIELRSAMLKRITPNSIMARIDANSGVSYKFGDGLSYANATEGPTATPVTTPAGPLVPSFTDQISRFDQNGMTNLFINPRTGPDPNNNGYRFFVRNTPGLESFDGSQAVVKIRARLTQPLTDAGVAQTMTVYARDLDGNDTNSDTVLGSIVIPADPKGADEYSMSVALNQFNTSTMTTVEIPLSSFAVNTSPMGGNPVGALFDNPGDGQRTDFNLFEFGAQVFNGGGLLRLEIEHMSIELPPANDADFDNSGTVDGRDFLTWQRGFGGAGTATTGDANGDGQVNTLDYNIWKSKFGGPPAVPASSSIPEPASATLAVAALAGAVAVRRRERTA
jgi:hypothetical protein